MKKPTESVVETLLTSGLRMQTIQMLDVGLTRPPCIWLLVGASLAQRLQTMLDNLLCVNAR